MGSNQCNIHFRCPICRAILSHSEESITTMPEDVEVSLMANTVSATMEFRKWNGGVMRRHLKELRSFARRCIITMDSKEDEYKFTDEILQKFNNIRKDFGRFLAPRSSYCSSVAFERMRELYFNIIMLWFDA